MSFIRLLLGIMLLPCCAGVTRTLVFTVSFGRAEAGLLPSLSVLALAGGFLLWTLSFVFLPRPMRAYVLAHELSHALWGTAMGAKVSGMRVSGGGGYVKLSDRNFLSVLAPYFFPLYAVVLVVAYYLASVFFDVRGLYLGWLAAVGAALGFHLSFTISALSARQSDVQLYGRLFSYSVIYFLCIAEIAALVAAATPGLTIELFAGRFAADIAWAWIWCWNGLAGGHAALFAR